MINIIDWCKQQEEPTDVLDKCTGLVYETLNYIRALLLKDETLPLPAIYVYDDGERVGIANPCAMIDPEPTIFVPQMTLEDW